MTTLLQVSDTHFGTERPDVVLALQRLSAELTPDVLLLSGDITQRATAQQFAAAREFIASLAIPARVVIAGNHDIPLLNLPLRVFRPYARFRSAFGHELEPGFESPDLLVIGVRTTRRWRHANGEVSRAQVERVASRLGAARPGQLRVVLVHQPVAVTVPEDDKNLLRGHQHAIDRWSAAGADLVVGGHIHLPYVVPLAAHGSMWAVQAGTAVSARIRRGADNSINVIRTVADSARRRCEVERWDYRPDRERFECLDRRTLSLRSVGVGPAQH